MGRRWGKEEGIETYPQFKMDYNARAAKCACIKENGNFSLRFTGYLNGMYSNSDPVRVLGIFRKFIKFIPIEISLTLENIIDTPEDVIAKLLCASLEGSKEEIDLYRSRIRESFH